MILEHLNITLKPKSIELIHLNSSLFLGHFYFGINRTFLFGVDIPSSPTV